MDSGETVTVVLEFQIANHDDYAELNIEQSLAIASTLASTLKISQDDIFDIRSERRYFPSTLVVSADADTLALVEQASVWGLEPLEFASQRLDAAVKSSYMSITLTRSCISCSGLNEISKSAVFLSTPAPTPMPFPASSVNTLVTVRMFIDDIEDPGQYEYGLNSEQKSAVSTTIANTLALPEADVFNVRSSVDHPTKTLTILADALLRSVVGDSRDPVETATSQLEEAVTSYLLTVTLISSCGSCNEMVVTEINIFEATPAPTPISTYHDITCGDCSGPSSSNEDTEFASVGVLVGLSLGAFGICGLVGWYFVRKQRGGTADAWVARSAMLNSDAAVVNPAHRDAEKDTDGLTEEDGYAARTSEVSASSSSSWLPRAPKKAPGFEAAHLTADGQDDVELIFKTDMRRGVSLDRPSRKYDNRPKPLL